MEDRLIALTPWALALLFELLGIIALGLALYHLSWQNLLSMGIPFAAIARSLPTVLQRLRDAWRAPTLLV